MKVVDMHCDTIYELYERRKKGGQEKLLKNDLHIDLLKMKKGDYFLQNFAVYTHLEREERPFEYAMRLIDAFYEEMAANDDRIDVVRSWQDIETNWKEG